MIDKKAIKPAVSVAVIVLLVFEALSIGVQLIDPEGGILRVNYRWKSGKPYNFDCRCTSHHGGGCFSARVL